MSNRFVSVALSFLFFVVFSKAGYGSSFEIDDSSAKKLVGQNVDLINKIVRNPSEASMQNWGKFGDHDIDTEVQFYMNSISDGSLSAYSNGSITLENAIKHSQKISPQEPSVALQYIRLSLMMYNLRAGPPPYFVISSIEKVTHNQIIAYCKFVFVDIDDSTKTTAGKIIYFIGGDVDSGITLERICIGGHAVYGWWYGNVETDCL